MSDLVAETLSVELSAWGEKRLALGRIVLLMYANSEAVVSLREGAIDQYERGRIGQVSKVTMRLQQGVGNRGWIWMLSNPSNIRSLLAGTENGLDLS